MEQPVTFTNRYGSRLFGMLYSPDRPVAQRVGVLVSVNAIKYRAGTFRLHVLLARKFCELGYYVLTFDPAGIGDSEGTFDCKLLSEHYHDIQIGKYSEDLTDATNYFFAEAKIDRMVLFGLCGGAIAVQMDVFVSERALHASGVVGRALEAMTARGFIYEKDGARWFKSEPFGDEKDRVVQRSDGELTYFAADIGYHGEKVSRGYDELIDVWGADHHGYVKRVAAAIEALGADPKKFQVILVQLVRLTRGGEPVRMGKRTGEFVTLREVVDEVGPDATRFFFLMRKGDSQLEFDLELATRQSSENPVFYCQYAHARICTLFRKAGEEGVAVPDAASADLEALVEAEEQEVVRLLAQMPDVIEDAAVEREPHRVVFHLIEIAGAFHRCYNRHRILGVEPRVRDARLYLARAVQRVLKLGLELLGIRAPESM